MKLVRVAVFEAFNVQFFFGIIFLWYSIFLML